METRKFSAKREKILYLLQSTKTHPGAYWVYEKLKPEIPNLSLGTVYRNLNLFCREKKALSLGVVRGEERFDGITELHPHLVCTRCGLIKDIHKSKVIDLMQKRFTLDSGFFIDFRKTMFYGLCKDCRDRGNSDPAA